MLKYNSNMFIGKLIFMINLIICLKAQSLPEISRLATNQTNLPILALKTKYNQQILFQNRVSTNQIITFFINNNTNEIVSYSHLSTSLTGIDIKINNTIQYLIYGSSKITKISNNGSILYTYNTMEPIENAIFNTIKNNQYIISKSSAQIIIIKSKIVYYRFQFPQQPTALAQDSTNNRIYIGTVLGSVYILYIPSYMNNLLGYWNFQQHWQNGGSPTNIITGKVSTMVNIVKYDNVGNIGLGSYGQFDSLSYCKEDYFSVPRDFTVSVWIRTFNNNLNYQRIVADYQNQQGYLLSAAYTIGNKVRIYWIVHSQYGQQIASSQITLLNNTWYFVVGVSNPDNNKIELYLNGVLHDSVQSLGINPSFDTGPFSIGGGFKNGQEHFFYGNIDQVMFFDRALSQYEISQLYSKTKWKITNIYHQSEISMIKVSLNSSKLITGDTSGNISLSAYNSDPLQMNPVIAYQYHTSKINSVIEANIEAHYYLISSDQNGNIIQTDLSGSLSQIHSQILTQANMNQLGPFSTYLGEIFNNSTFYSASLSSTKLLLWNISVYIPPSSFPAPSPSPAPAHASVNQTQNVTEPVIQTPGLQCSDIYSKCNLNQSLQILNCNQALIDLALIQQDGSYCALLCGKYYNVIGNKCVKRSQQIARISETASQILSIPNIRVILKALVPIFAFLDDIWFYRFHYQQYSDFIQNLFQQIKRINQIRVVPSLLPLDQFQAWVGNIGENSLKIYKQYVPPQILLKQSIFTKNYFANTKDIIIIGNFYICFGFLILFLVSLVFKCLAKKIIFFEKMSQWCLIRVKIPYILFGMIEVNLITLSFYSFFQFSSVFFLNFQSKFYIALSYMCLAVFVLYSFSFYFLCYGLGDKKNVQPILSYTKYQFKSFLQATFNNSSKLLINGFLHSYLGDIYLIQIILITMVNFCQSISIIYFIKCYEFKITWFLHLTYQTCFTILNFAFIYKHFYSYTEILQFAQIILVSLMIGSTILLIACQIITKLGECIVDKFKQINKIQPELAEKKKVEEQNKTYQNNNETQENQSQSNLQSSKKSSVKKEQSIKSQDFSIKKESNTQPNMMRFDKQNYINYANQKNTNRQNKFKFTASEKLNYQKNKLKALKFKQKNKTYIKQFIEPQMVSLKNQSQANIKMKNSFEPSSKMQDDNLPNFKHKRREGPHAMMTRVKARQQKVKTYTKVKIDQLKISYNYPELKKQDDQLEQQQQQSK